MTDTLSLEATVHSPGAIEGDPEPYAGRDSFTFVRLRVRDADGATGEGFTGRFLATEVAHFLNAAVAEAIPAAGANLMDSLTRRFNPRQMTGVFVSAISALDLALWDLRAKRQGVSIASLLGGRRAAAPVHVTCGFPDFETDALVEACAREIAGGAAGVKVLVAARGRPPSEDAARLRAVREAIGPEADLIADANCGMKADTALEFARLVVDLNLKWLEEPVRGNDRHALRELAATGLVPLGAGQMEQSADRFALLAEAGVRVIQPNAVFAGGLSAAVSAAQRARAAGCMVSPAGGWDAINLQWMCGAMDDGPVELHRAQARIARLLFAEPLRIAEGALHLPGAPGFGYAPNEDALRHCRIDRS